MSSAGVNAERFFTLEQANAEVEELKMRLPRLRTARRALIASSRAISDAVEVDGGGIANSGWFEAQSQLKADLTYLAERGILLRDADTGLVDFPMRMDGRVVYLCWRLDEDRVGFFHEKDSGYSGRKPL